MSDRSLRDRVVAIIIESVTIDPAHAERLAAEVITEVTAVSTPAISAALASSLRVSDLVSQLSIATERAVRDNEDAASTCACELCNECPAVGAAFVDGHVQCAACRGEHFIP